MERTVLKHIKHDNYAHSSWKTSTPQTVNDLPFYPQIYKAN